MTSYTLTSLLIFSSKGVVEFVVGYEFVVDVVGFVVIVVTAVVVVAVFAVVVAAADILIAVAVVGCATL